MNAIEHLAGREWEHPSNYGGFSPDGDFVILTRTRDSSALEQSNYAAAFETLREVAAAFPDPEDDDEDERSVGWVYDFRACHWGCGWVETLLVRADAPELVLITAGEIICALAEYPVLDDEDFNERENDQIDESWAYLSTKERLRLLSDCNAEVSYFCVRRSECPDDWRVRDALRAE